ncbi:ATP-binding protein [Candidatus Poribacteria bacterium]|nr:ATP-binding protein [Candidatus Poribacteria bacterium]
MLINSGTSRSIVLHGNIHDLFFIQEEKQEDYIPLVPFLTRSWDIPGFILLVYELNGPLRFLSANDRNTMKVAYHSWRKLIGSDLTFTTTLTSERNLSELSNQKALKPDGFVDDKFEEYLNDAIGSPTLALELLRQFCLISRSETPDGKPLLYEKLIILIEATDMLLPEGEIRSLNLGDRHRVSIVQDWISDSDFMKSSDTVVFISESRSLINSRIMRLPQVVSVEIPSPDEKDRRHFISWFNRTQKPNDKELNLWGSQSQLGMLTAGLSIQALRQLLLSVCYSGEKLQPETVIEKVSDFIQAQLGEDVVEFKKPNHSLKDIIGNRKLIEYLRTQLIPRITSTGKDAIAGFSVCGPIGSGKTFIFEGLAGELDIPVLVLKNIRSMWFGQTDVIFERLRRLLMALVNVLIFVDEADTQFGGVGTDAHSTERRLTGKIQAMMSDPQLRGNITWLLMTARIYNLSPDLRREGRVGDIVIPVLDPIGEDRKEFIKWTLDNVIQIENDEEKLEHFQDLTEGYSAASFGSLRADLEAAKVSKGELTENEILEVISDRILPNIGPIREYQTLQAYLNCTRKSLLPVHYTPEIRESWRRQIAELESRGVSG